MYRTNVSVSAYATAAYLKNNLKFPEDKKVYVIGEAGLEHELDAVGIKHIGGSVCIQPIFRHCFCVSDVHLPIVGPSR